MRPPPLRCVNPSRFIQVSLCLLLGPLTSFAQVGKAHLSVQTCGVYNMASGDHCLDSAYHVGVDPHNIDYSLYGTCLRNSFTFSAGWRIEKRFYRSIGGIAGIDLSLRRALRTRSGAPSSPTQVIRASQLEWQVENPLYLGCVKERWSFGVGAKLRLILWLRSYRETEAQGRFQSFSDDRVFTQIVLQPSLHGSARLAKWKGGDLRLILEADHRGKYIKGADPYFIDLALGCSWQWR